MHLRAAGRHLRLLPRPVGADEVDDRPGAVAGHEVAAVARVVLGRDHLPGDVEALPAEPLEDGRQHRHQVVREQDVEERVETAEVVGDQLAQPAVGQVLEADVEALVEGAVPRPDRAHVRLHRHQQHGVEALGLPVAGVLLDLLGGGPPGQRPGRVGDHQRGSAVGVDELATRRRHPPEAVLVRAPRPGGQSVEAGDRARATGEPGVVDARRRRPVPGCRRTARRSARTTGPRRPRRPAASARRRRTRSPPTPGRRCTARSTPRRRSARSAPPARVRSGRARS